MKKEIIYPIIKDMSNIEIIDNRLPEVESLRSQQVIPVDMHIIVPNDWGLMAILSEKDRQESLRKAVGMLEENIFGALPRGLTGKRFLVERSLNLISPGRNEKVNSGLVRGMVVSEGNRNQLSNFEGSISEVLNSGLKEKMGGATYQSMPYYEAILDLVGKNLTSKAPRPQILVMVTNSCPERTDINYTMMNKFLEKTGDWCPEIWVLPIIRGKGVRTDLDTRLDIHNYWEKYKLGSRYGVIPVYAKPESYNQAKTQALAVSNGRLNLGTLFERR